jgi:hypothetical protein
LCGLLPTCCNKIAFSGYELTEGSDLCILCQKYYLLFLHGPLSPSSPTSSSLQVFLKVPKITTPFASHLLVGGPFSM